MQCTGSLLLFFCQLPYHYFSRQKVLTQWAQPSLHYPRSYYHFFFIGTNLMFACFQMYVKSTFFYFFSTFIWFFFSPQTCVDLVGATIFTFPVVIQLNVFIAVPNHFVFWKSKIFFYKFQLEGGNAVIFHARHENDLKTKQSQKAFRRRHVQYSRKICLRLTVFVLNQVRVFVSGAYRHTQHAQTWLFLIKKIHKQIISEEKIIISTLDKYCAFIIVNFILYFIESTSAQIGYALTVCLWTAL